MFLGNITKYHFKRGQEPINHLVLSSGKYNLKVKMGAFGAKARNSTFQTKFTKISRLPSNLWGSSISKMFTCLTLISL